MIIGGFQRFSLIDYPDKISAIVFTQGCNFRCPYCHNPELVDPKNSANIRLKEDEILSFLDRRKGKLNAVTITGGEPLLQSDLSAFLSAIKRLRYLVKLDTNGSFPSRLKKIIELKSVDYIAMDIKTSLDKYHQVIKRKIDTRKILDSIRLVMDSGLDYEFRTTVVKALFEKDDLSWTESDPAIFNFYKQLISMRKEHPALRSTDLNVVAHNHPDRALSFFKSDGTERLLAVLNFSGDRLQLTPDLTPIDAGAVFKELFSGKTYRNLVQIDLPAYAVMLFKLQTGR